MTSVSSTRPAGHSGGSGGGRCTPLGAVLALVFIGSLGTGIFWSGVFFVTERTYEFSSAKNLAFGVILGVVYTIGAFTAGRVVRLAPAWVSERMILAGVLALQAIACMLPLVIEHESSVWIASLVATYTASVLWPIVESYVTTGRHGAAMRSAIGWFNVTWTTAVTAPMLFAAFVLETRGEWVVGILAPANVVGLIILFWFQRRTAHDEHVEEAGVHVGREYPALLKSVRILLPLSYLLMAAMTPLLPYLLNTLNVAIFWKTPVSATWMFARVASLAVMWNIPFWHGRWGTLLLGGLMMPLGFAVIVLSPSLGVLFVGFAIFGAALGIVYYAALYYAMAVGRAEVDAGGTHEGLIGVGYALGPAAALVGMTAGGGEGVVAMVWAMITIGALPAVLPFVRARKRRGAHEGR